MKAITVLARCRGAEDDVRRIRQRINQRREAAQSVSPRMDAGGGHGSAGSEKMDAFVAAIDKLERMLEEREMERRAEVVACSVLLEALPENESAVLHEYYIQRQKVSGIARKLGYTDGYIRTLKAQGEKMLDEVGEEVVALALPAWYLRGNHDQDAAEMG